MRNNITVPESNPLTPNETHVLNFLKEFKSKHGISPSYEDIRKKLKLAQRSSVQQYLSQLEKKGYVRFLGLNRTRAVELVGVSEMDFESTTSLPLLGQVAAGRPIERSFHDRFIEIPKDMLRGPGEYFALLVKGDSMIDEGILEGDFVIVRRQPNAENGQKVVALIDNEATIKKFIKRKDKVELHSCNQNYKPIKVESSHDFRIEGVFAGLIRLK